ncbi:MAG: hypothetical protein N3I35_00450, partial [Clostridia bacterium]|nr:hypothetical protein [Clostridia bacterium]
IWDWRLIIALTILVLVVALLEWQKTKTVLYALMLQAKRMAKDALLESGKEQEEWVVNKAMRYLPLYVRLLVGEKQIRVFVKLLFSKLKDYVDDGVINNSI